MNGFLAGYDCSSFIGCSSLFYEFKIYVRMIIGLDNCVVISANGFWFLAYLYGKQMLLCLLICFGKFSNCKVSDFAL